MQTPTHDSQKLFSKRRLASLFCLLTVVLAILLGNVFLSAMPPRPYPVLSTARWTGGSSKFVGFRPYQWLANGDLAYLVSDARGRLQVCYQKMDDHDQLGAVRHGPLLPLHATALRFFPSPDEQWVAYLQSVGRNSYQTVLLSADGRTTRTDIPVGEHFAEWLGDSRSFLTYCSAPNSVLKVHHFDSPHTEAIAGALPSERPVPMSAFETGPDFLIGGNFRSTPCCLGESPENYPLMTLRSFHSTQPDVVQRTWQVPVPTDREDGAGVVSPDTKHILWITDGLNPSPFTRWTTDLVPAWRNTSKWTRCCFVSDLHGNNRHVVLNQEGDGPSEIEPRWTPDSKHLSFIERNQLYFIPVE